MYLPIIIIHRKRKLTSAGMTEQKLKLSPFRLQEVKMESFRKLYRINSQGVGFGTKYNHVLKKNMKGSGR